VVNALCDSYVNVARHDFPGFWPAVPQELGAAVTSGDAGRTLVALKVLYALARFFKWKKYEDPLASPYNHITSALMLPLQQLGAHLAAQLPGGAPEVALALKLVLKVYYASIYFRLADYPVLCDPGAFGRWAALCVDVLRIPLPPPGAGSACPADPEERAQWAPWKAKKWAARVLARVAERWVKPDTDEAAAKPVAALFKASVAPAAVGLALEQLVAWAAERGAGGSEHGGAAWVSPPVRATYYSLLESTSDFKSVWVPLKPHVRIVVTSLVPLDMSATEAELADFTEAPEEWLLSEQGGNVWDSAGDPRDNAERLLIGLLNKRKKTVLPLIEEFTAGVLGAPRHPLKKDTLLRMLGAVSGPLSRSPKWRATMEGVLTGFVTPEIVDAAAPALLRARAIKFWELCTDPAWRVGPAATLVACEAVFRCLADASLPIRQVAASVIAAFIANSPDCRAAMRPYVPAIVERLAVLCAEVGLDSVVSTLNALVSVYHAEVPVLAGPVVAIVVRQALTLLENASEETEDEYAVATETCFHVVRQVVDLLQTPPDGPDGAQLTGAPADAYLAAAGPALRDAVLPTTCALLRRFLDVEKGDTCEWLDDSLGLLGDVVDAVGEAGGLAGNPALWTLLVAAQRYVARWGAAYVEPWAYPTQAALAYGGAPALAAPVPTEWGPADFAAEVLAVVSSVHAECAEDEQAFTARTVGYSLLLRGRGALDRHLPLVVRLYSAALLAARTKPLISEATATLCCALMYDASGALAALVAVPEPSAVLKIMFDELARVAALPGEAARLRAEAAACGKRTAEDDAADAERNKPVANAQTGALALACVMRAAAGGALPPSLVPHVGPMSALALRLAVAEFGWRRALEAARASKLASAEAAERDAAEAARPAPGHVPGAAADFDDAGGGEDEGSVEEDSLEEGYSEEEEEEDEFGELEGAHAHINTPMFFVGALRALYASPLRAAVEPVFSDPALAVALQSVTQHVAALEAQGAPAPEIGPPPIE
jgi:hypothetical protein